MDPTEAKRALDILDGTHGLSADELESYLDSVCGENSLLRREVLSYLDYNTEGTVLPAGTDSSTAPEIPYAAVSETRYDLGDEIARGGMGLVLRAFDNNILRDVAVKVLRSELESKPDVIRRFLQEAQISGQLQHPGIAPVYEIGRLPDGRLFIAMKLVNGATLEKLLAQRQGVADDQAEFLGIFEHVCQTIAFAHRRSVIHRDLKPSNVMVGEFGEVQVMDWGIAKSVNDTQPEAPESEGLNHGNAPASDPVKVDTDGIGHSTRVGQFMGTPAYMAPEQAIGRAGKTTDVFSLGAILYEILTGEKTASDAGDASEQLDRCGCDQELADLAKDCLQRSEADRPQNVGLVASRISAHLNAIQARLKEAEIATARAEVRADEERKRRHRTLWTIAGVAMLLVIAGAVIAFVRHSAYQRSLRTQTEMTVTSLSTSHGILVPRVIDDLQELPREMVLPELHQQFNDGDESRRFRLAYGLAGFGDVRVDLLVSKMATCSPDEVDNLVQALGNSSDEAVSALVVAAQHADTAEDWRLKARLAMLALHLGAPRLATDMCQPQADPIQRSFFIDECSTWYGSLSRLALSAANVGGGSLRSAIALTVGSVPTADARGDARQAWQKLLADWYQRHPDTGTHSAAGWALRKWNLELPTIVASKQPSEERRWHHNSVGMTMLKFPVGSFVGEHQARDGTIKKEHTVSRSFLLADREVTRAQFEQFVDDREYPDDDKPIDWREPAFRFRLIRNSPTVEHPVQTVNWYDAVLFCNWLSRQEGLMTCYEREGQEDELVSANQTPEQWRLIADASGYRLPMELEWEYACRAGTATSFHFGEEESLLDRYAVHDDPLHRLNALTGVPGSKLPNAWGLFDMHGNVWELCQDWNKEFNVNATGLSDRSPTFSEVYRTRRGGSGWSPVEHLRSACRFPVSGKGRDDWTGFRVARSSP